MSLPAQTHRLFSHYAAEDAASSAAFVFGRVLEDGDRHDLAALFNRTGEAPLAAWLAERGGRQLSRRSRAFWSMVLATVAGPCAEGHDDLWPL